ncbi:MAG TPA: sorbosone dehydrogenase family protein, partial [Blastocatellia bacterium]|nr:sorbosone dehydrogenase family protein [Blastocatellia bacterium]
MRSNRIVLAIIRAAARAQFFSFTLLALALLACAQSTPQPSGSKPGELRHTNITLADLPPAEVQKGPVNFSKVVPRPEGAELTLPLGFEIGTFAEGDLQRPRWLAQAPNGDVFVAESEGNRISILRDSNGDGKVDERFVFASGLARPFGMAFWRDYLYVGDTDAVVRFAYKPGQTKAEP